MKVLLCYSVNFIRYYQVVFEYSSQHTEVESCLKSKQSLITFNKIYIQVQILLTFKFCGVSSRLIKHTGEVIISHS